MVHSTVKKGEDWSSITACRESEAVAFFAFLVGFYIMEASLQCRSPAFPWLYMAFKLYSRRALWLLCNIIIHYRSSG